MYEHLQKKDFDKGEKYIDFDKGHGRIEKRSISVLENNSLDLDFPFIQQVFKLERMRLNTYGEIMSIEETYGITSLDTSKTSPQRILEGIRGHWHIENKLHYIRDVTFLEDRSQVRDGNSAHIWASLRNLVIDVIKRLGFKDIPSGRRYFGFRSKSHILAVLGIN